MLPSFDTPTPFVLLDDARAGGSARLFTDPDSTLTAHRVADLPAALEALAAALDRGLIAAGYLAYEAGAAFEPRWPTHNADSPLLWFGLFEGGEHLSSGQVAETLPDPNNATITGWHPLVDERWHAAAVERALSYIAAGDIYQANLTFPCAVDWSGDPLALYARIRAASAAGYGGIVWTGERLLLSASPELFLTLDGGRVTTRPMKGTALRSGDPATDRARAVALSASAKDRAENLMITDLMRNDLSRVAHPGSVRTSDLFSIETYPTILQMTSTVEADLRDGLGPLDLLRAAFPCGSITGAPKLRAAEIIRELEVGSRGAYTGSIGWMSRDAASFNVAIRTLEIAGGETRLDLGSAIVADSDPAAEWRECLAKGAFLSR